MKKNEMQCKDFREIADSYLSDELLVETNHEVFRHLENCEKCRRDLAARRELRTKLNTAIINAPESNIDEIFAAKLRQSLEKKALEQSGFSNFFRAFDAPKVFALTAAALIIAALIGFGIWRKQENQNQITANNSEDQNTVAINNDIYKTAWINLSEAAAEDHNHCGLGNYNYWTKNDVTETAEEKTFKEKVLSQIRSETAQPVKLVTIHDCDAMGKSFHHAIMNVGEHKVSITQTAVEINTDTDGIIGMSNIFTLRRENFELAGFTDKSEVFYVVSDLPKAENTRIAEIFSGSLQARNASAFNFASVNYSPYKANANF